MSQADISVFSFIIKDELNKKHNNGITMDVFAIFYSVHTKSNKRN